jgi:hypothetical protein
MKPISLIAVVVVAAGCGGSSFTSPGQTEGAGGVPGVTGGSEGSGGTNASGGKSGGGQGGRFQTGGSTGSGGSTADGGATGSGGNTATGGATGSGGSTATGGATGSGGGVSTDGGTSTVCKQSGDCLPTDFCAKALCSESIGFCKQRPTACPSSEFNPFCGCDGVNYGNDCLRMAHGVSASARGECANGTGAMCGGMAGKQCPTDGATCAMLFTDQSLCQVSDMMGACWVVAPQCPGVTIGGTWRACSGTGVCYDTCKALQQQGPFFRDTSTACPQ